MSQFKNNPKFKLLYTDTDSVFVEGELPSEMVGRELGKFKLEYTFKEAIFLGPKLYAGYTTADQYICKIRGFKGIVPYKIFQQLLTFNAKAILSQNKHQRSLTEIKMFDQLFELTQTQIKRTLQYNKYKIAVSTNPVLVKDGIEARVFFNPEWYPQFPILTPPKL